MDIPKDTQIADLKITNRLSQCALPIGRQEGTQAQSEIAIEGLPEDVRFRRFDLDLPAIGRQEPTVLYKFVNGRPDPFCIFVVGPIECP